MKVTDIKSLYRRAPKFAIAVQQMIRLPGADFGYTKKAAIWGAPATLMKPAAWLVAVGIHLPESRGVFGLQADLEAVQAIAPAKAARHCQLERRCPGRNLAWGACRNYGHSHPCQVKAERVDQAFDLFPNWKSILRESVKLACNGER